MVVAVVVVMARRGGGQPAAVVGGPIAPAELTLGRKGCQVFRV